MCNYKFGKKVSELTVEERIKWLEQDIHMLFRMRGLTSQDVKRGLELLEKWKVLTGYIEPEI